MIDREQFLNLLVEKKIQNSQTKDEIIYTIQKQITEFYNSVENRIDILQKFYETLKENLSDYAIKLQTIQSTYDSLQFLLKEEKESLKDYKSDLKEQVEKSFELLQTNIKEFQDKLIEFAAKLKELESLKDSFGEFKEDFKTIQDIATRNYKNIKEFIKVFEEINSKLAQVENFINENIKDLSSRINVEVKNAKNLVYQDIDLLKRDIKTIQKEQAEFSVGFSDIQKKYEKKIQEISNTVNNIDEKVENQLQFIKDKFKSLIEEKFNLIKEQIEIIKENKEKIQEDDTIEVDYTKMEDELDILMKKLEQFDEILKSFENKIHDIEVKVNEKKEIKEKPNLNESIDKYIHLFEDKIQSQFNELEKKFNIQESVNQLRNEFQNKLNEAMTQVNRTITTMAGSGIGLHELHHWLKENNYLSMGDDGTFKIKGNNLPNNIKNISLDSDYFSFELDDDTLHINIDMPNDLLGNYLTEVINITKERINSIKVTYPIKVGSETVKWNGVILTRGQENDYTINGNIITFNQDIELLPGDKIEVTYLK